MHLRMLPTKYEKEIVNYSSNHYKYGLLELYTIKNFPSIKTAYIPISWNIAVLHIPKKSSSHVYPHAPHCIYNRFIINGLCSKDKKIALIHALILSQCFEVYFHINYLFSATYHFLIDRFDLI